MMFMVVSVFMFPVMAAIATGFLLPAAPIIASMPVLPVMTAIATGFLPLVVRTVASVIVLPVMATIATGFLLPAAPIIASVIVLQFVHRDESAAVQRRSFEVKLQIGIYSIATGPLRSGSFFTVHSKTSPE